MMSYQLDIRVPSGALAEIYERGYAIAIVKHVTTVPSYPALPLVWVAFRPYEWNRVSWDSGAHFFATTVRSLAGTMIPLTLASKKLKAGGEYEFTGDGFRQIARDDLPGSFRLRNKTNDARTFGLAQELQVGEAVKLEPVNAVTIEADRGMIFTPVEALTLFVATEFVPAGTILDRVPENALTVAFTESRPSMTAVYDTATRAFRIA